MSELSTEDWWLKLNRVLDELKTRERTEAWVESMGETTESYSNALLQLARNERSTDGLAVSVMFIEQVWTEESVEDQVIALVYEDWHFHHASLLRLLEGRKSEAALDALEELARNRPATGEVDDDSVADQATRAIAHHPSPRKTAVLESLAETARPVARDRALEELGLAPRHPWGI